VLTTNLLQGENEIGVEIVNVNGVSDQSTLDNSLEYALQKDENNDEYPLVVDFESVDNWALASSGGDTLWNRVQLEGNRALRAIGFNATDLSSSSWFISPRLNTGGLDSAGLYFRASYASKEGFNDRLQVLLSTDCGQSYFPSPLLDVDSDSLAVTTSETRWTPSSDADWKEYQIDLSQTFFFDNDIRIAFVFTPGGGNDLFIDDINIRANDPPTYENVFRTYPNPATTSFNVGLNLPQKEEVIVRLVDLSGRIVFEQKINNALNQVLNYQAPNQEGLYILNVSGSRFSTSQKLFINR